MLKKYPADKKQNKETLQNTLFFLSRAPTLHSFTFNLQFLHDLKHKVYLPKRVCGIFHFRFRLVLMKVRIFLGVFDFKT